MKPPNYDSDPACIARHNSHWWATASSLLRLDHRTQTHHIL